MTSRSRNPVAAVHPGRLAQDEIDTMLDRRLIAKLGTLDERNRPHLVGMWFRRDGDAILMPTSHYTRKARNLRANPFAAVMIDDSRAGLALRGVLVRGPVELIEGEDAFRLNRSIHLRYVTERGLALDDVASYLVEGDDVTIRVRMEEVHSWNLAGSPAGRALVSSGEFHPLDGE